MSSPRYGQKGGADLKNPFARIIHGFGGSWDRILVATYNGARARPRIPLTDRIQLAAITWRVIAPIGSSHPMHLQVVITEGLCKKIC